jgi:3-hydroxyacyl-CoA dehydrogenase
MADFDSWGGAMETVNDVTTLEIDGEDVAVITVNSPPVNALSAPVRDGIAEAVRRAIADERAKAIVLMCAGRTFVAGADIREFGKPPQGTSLLDLESLIENAPKPVIAAIHGTALGGGLELALACHYRVAVPSAKCGFPEIKLGLLPGATGSQKLPRLVGVAKALEIEAFGDYVPAPTCVEIGLIDELIQEDRLRDAAIAYARRAVAQSFPLRKIGDMVDKLVGDQADPGIFDRFRKANARKFRGFDAPEAVIRCIEAATRLPYEKGLKYEREEFRKLLNGTQSAAQRYAFFAEREVWKVPGLSKDTPMRPIKTIGIVGAGTMGGGIAMNFANAGLPATIVEATREALDRGLGIIRKNYENSARRGRLSASDVEKRIGLITGTLDIGDLDKADLIVEAVFENMDVKKEVFRKLDKIAKPSAILASNTSYLNVDEIASVTGRPGDILGLHFFSPANVMRLVEVVRAAKTEDDVLATCLDMAKKIRKIAATVGVCHGFVGNRMLAKRQQEAAKLILEGAMPWDVDKVLYDFGMPMGPFQMGDLAGLDIGWTREASTSSTIREVLCEQGRRGQKTGVGFYDYDDKRNPSPSLAVEKIILDFSAKKGISRRPIGDDEILERCIYPMINEGAKILEEGIALRASDIDIIWINGYGWPAYRGGPMFYGDMMGLGPLVDSLRTYESKFGVNFTPAPLLEKLAAEDKSFRDL